MVQDNDYVAINSAGFFENNFLMDEAERMDEKILAAKMRADLVNAREKVL
jgi:hypothetical protein